MSKQFPKLQAKLNEIQIRLNEVLRDEFIDIDIDPIEDVELTIRMRSFIPHSTTTKLCSLLRKSLNETLEPTAKVTLKDVASAQVLLKLGRDHELAINVLTKALERQVQPQEARDSVNEAKEVSSSARKALAESASEITKFNESDSTDKPTDSFLFFNTVVTIDGKQCDFDGTIADCPIDDSQYQLVRGKWKQVS
jgi:hypothetical protein